ncbi:DNA polymerase III subunit beta [Allorhizobium undicola]|uniref:DNA polymerase III subunit beta n=1 Tax=Allorhizobium undicola TaxID=78527 RepID=UPI0004890913|nr:DNA polymerase III subunit beta [Allorhizobium undicola]
MAEVPLFRAHRSQLLPALMAAFEAVEKRSGIPILQNVLLSPDGDRLLLRATDMTIEVETSCDLLDCQIDTAITLSGEGLRDIVRSMPEAAELNFLLDEARGQVRIHSGGSRFALSYLPAAGFPSISEYASSSRFPIDLQGLIAGINRVKYAVKEDKARTYLSGTYLHPSEDGSQIVVVGCDGHNLGIYQFAARTPVSFRGILLPIKTTAALAKLFSDSGSDAEISVSETMAHIVCGDIKLTTKLVDGIFPDYARVIPRHNELRAVVHAGTLNGAIARVCVVAKDTDKDAVEISLKSGTMRVSMLALDAEEAVEDIPADYGDKEISIKFHGDYLRKMLASIKTQDVLIRLSDPATGGLFQPATETGEIYVIMPRR